MHANCGGKEGGDRKTPQNDESGSGEEKGGENDEGWACRRGMEVDGDRKEEAGEEERKADPDGAPVAEELRGGISSERRPCLTARYRGEVRTVQKFALSPSPDIC